MFRIITTAALAAGTLTGPAFAADLADLPSCLKPRTLSSVTATITQASVIKDPLGAPGFRTSDPACTYQVARLLNPSSRKFPCAASGEQLTAGSGL